MAATNPGLGAYIQAQKRQKQIEDQIAKAHGEDGDGGKSKKDKEKEKEKDKEQPTVAGLAKTVAKEVIGAVKEATKTEDPDATMDGSVARIVQFSDSDDEGGEKLKPRPAPELPPKRPPQQQRPEHKNMLGEGSLTLA